jgi:hypothetical protein
MIGRGGTKNGRSDWEYFRDNVKNSGGAHCHLVHRHRAPKGCIQPVLKAEKSRGGGYMLGGAGIDATSSAQSRRVGAGVEYCGTGLNRGSSRGRGGKIAAGGVSDTLVAARDMGSSEMDRLQGVWGKLGGCNMFGGRSGVSRPVLRRS